MEKSKEENFVWRVVFKAPIRETWGYGKIHFYEIVDTVKNIKEKIESIASNPNTMVCFEDMIRHPYFVSGNIIGTIRFIRRLNKTEKEMREE